MKDIWLSSDQHFSHSMIITYCGRPFADKEEMDAVMIERWNSLVKPNDIIYVLGDFCWGRPEKYVEQLNGEKHLILGNHDRQSIGVYRQNFTSVDNYKEIKIPGNSVCLEHYPIYQWNRRYYGSLHCHGHCHGLKTSDCRRMDVGVDTNNFYPYNLDEIITILSAMPIGKEYVKKEYENQIYETDS